MRIFKRNSGNYNSNPPEQVLVPDTGLVLNVWTAETLQGIRRHWALARAGDNGAVYKTCRIESLFSLPLFIQKVAKAFSQYDDLPAAQREHLNQLASVMEQVVRALSANGFDKTSEEPKTSTLAFE